MVWPLQGGGYIGNNGKENGNYRDYRDYVGVINIVREVLDEVLEVSLACLELRAWYSTPLGFFPSKHTLAIPCHYSFRGCKDMHWLKVP